MSVPILHLRIISPKQIIYEGDILSCSSVNSKGKFDIIAQTANFITFIDKDPIIVRDLQKKRLTFNFDSCLIYNSNNQVTIYTEINSANITKTSAGNTPK